MAVLERIQFIPRPRREVFSFFEKARNLEAITPSFLKFRVTTPEPIDMRAGTLIDYRLSLFGVPFTWKTVIEEYAPDERFVDRQLAGPYRKWVHLHTFSDVPGGTEMKDRVEYEVPFGPIGAVARTLFVDRTVRRIFDYRAEVIRQTFPSPASGS